MTASLRLLASIGRLHIVAIAALGTFTFSWLLYGRRAWALAGVCALDWFLVNLLNRVVDLREDAANRIVGTEFVARHKRAVLAVGFGALFASLALVHLAMPTVTPWRVGYHLLGFAYNWPLLPGRRRIKQLYFWKNTASAVGFLLTLFAYPLALYGAGEHAPLARGVTAATVVVTMAFFFLFELSYEVVYDLRDAPGDAAVGVRTYPVVHGERGAVRIIDALLFAASVALVAGWVAGVVPWRIAVMVAAPVVQVVVYKRAVRRGVTSRDCVRLTWIGAALLVAYHLWIAAGLPGVDA
jgi:4-hydroxybenzoate polyprenyltransferase